MGFTIGAENVLVPALLVVYSPLLFLGVVILLTGQTIGGNSSPVSKTTKKDVLLELMEVSKALQMTITSSTIRKRNVEKLIKMLTKEKNVKGEKVDHEKENQSANEKEENVDSSESSC
ncbi:hypothetical protein KIW84_011823 [Lathyrus oleraceus]|uniref:Uncharacterized protein n=1 Tax=Pisum sativum TaxID=3888 RepID=A0A9D5BG30_PEA|nr:hypothetical protein KIW84_011823 [Pisum sativum]